MLLRVSWNSVEALLKLRSATSGLAAYHIQGEVVIWKVTAIPAFRRLAGGG